MKPILSIIIAAIAAFFAFFISTFFFSVLLSFFPLAGKGTVLILSIGTGAAVGYYTYQVLNKKKGAVNKPVISSTSITGSATAHYPPRPTMFTLQDNTHGTAFWANPEAINWVINDDAKPEPIDGEGYFIGERYIVQKLTHAVCIAGSGQGKGVNLIIPNLLKKPFASWFVLDPKGENAQITARWQKESGQKVVILDPWNEQKRLGATHGIEPMGFNPLQFAKSNPDELVESCGVIAEMIVPDSPGAKDAYWENRARSLIKTYILHLITARPDNEQHLGTIYRWLRLPPRERQRLWFEMDENDAHDGLVKSGIGEFMGLSDESGPLPSIISNAQDNTTFLESAPLRASLEKNEFDPYSLTDGKTTVYLCLPERFLNSHARWLRLVVGICLKACNYLPGKRVNFLLDEFAILGKMKEVERAFAFARGQNISVWIFVQSLTQLMEIYGEHGANTFLSNARLRQFFGVFDLKTQQYLSEYIGDTTISTVTESETTSDGRSSGSSAGGSTSGSNWSTSKSTNYQSTSRRLITVEEVGKQPKMITLIDGYKFLLARLPYWDSFYKAYDERRYQYYPMTDAEWHTFIDNWRAGDTSNRLDIKNVFLPRADTRSQAN